MRTTFTLAATALALLASGSSAAAQQRVTFDLRVAAAMPNDDLADADLQTGFGFGSTLAFRLQPHLHIYGGWDWMHFSSDQSFAGGELDFEETGYTFGLRFEHPFKPDAQLAYRLEAGGIYKHVEIEDDEGDLVADSGHELGFEAGAGLLVPLGAQWSLTPTIRLRSFEPSFTIGTTTTDGTMRYIGFELGISRRFW
jgi:hypothetical protein